MTGKERFLNTVDGLPADRTPVFPLLMYLAADRNHVSYRTYVTDPAALAESQLMVAEKFGIDVVSPCSDPVRLCTDLGGDVAYPEHKTPYVVKPLVETKEDLQRLKQKAAALLPGKQMWCRIKAVEQMAADGRFATLGWVDLPFAEACEFCGVSEFMMIMYDQPELAHELLDFLAEKIILFVEMQIEAGADMIGCGDAAASLISPEFYREFALPYAQKVFAFIRKKGNRGKLHICGNTSRLMPDMAETGADLFNVDHMVDLAAARAVYSAKGLAYKGNLDPVYLLFHDAEEIGKACRELLRQTANTKYVLSAGCEIPAGVSDEKLMVFCNSVK